jgi:hypothetical protein
MRTKLREYEEDSSATPCPFSDDEARDFFAVVKWHYWNILYSLIGDELENIDPQFKRSEVPIIVPGIEILFETEQLPPEEPTMETQAPDADGEPPAFLNNKTVSTKDPVKVTLNWLRNRDRQYIKRHTEPDRPVMANGAIDYIEPTKSEWRITKPAAHIYRELCKAAETGEILLAKAAVPDFMINNLRRKDGDDITKDSLTHADKRPKTDKRRQKPTK